MTRARFVLGGADLQARFDAVRQAVITAPRDQAALRGEIVAMREKVRAAHPVKDGRFDIRVTNELEETLYADRLQLLSVAHPRGVTVFPNEGMTDLAKPFHLGAGGGKPVVSSGAKSKEVMLVLFRRFFTLMLRAGSST